MLQEWTTELEIEENQFIITEMAKKKALSKEEYINLINLMIYYYAITEKPNTLEGVMTICNQIELYREMIAKNQNHELFVSCLTQFLQAEFLQTGNLNKLHKFLKEGFIFHSFNYSFSNQIEENGLIVKEKPWSLEEVETVRSIFTKKNNRNIFGLYQGRDTTPIFFANNLVSSAYYGLSSPTFFRKFIENKTDYFNVYLNRDYAKAKESIELACQGLDESDKKTVLSFFHKYWKEFATDDFPCLAVSTKKKLGIEESTIPLEGDIIHDTLKQILDTKNFTKHDNIRREDLEIFHYQSLTFSPIAKEKYIA